MSRAAHGGASWAARHRSRIAGLLAAPLIVMGCAQIPPNKPHGNPPYDCSLVVEPTTIQDPQEGLYTISNLTGHSQAQWWVSCGLLGFQVKKITREPNVGWPQVDIWLRFPHPSGRGSYTTSYTHLWDRVFFDTVFIVAHVAGVSGVSGSRGSSALSK